MRLPSVRRGSADTIVVMLGAMMFLRGAWYVSVTGWMNAQGLAGLTAWVYSVCPLAALAIRGQAQGLLVLLTQGLGMLVGAFVFARLVGVYQGPPGAVPDWRAIWLWPCAMAAAVALVFWLLFRDRGASRS